MSITFHFQKKIKLDNRIKLKSFIQIFETTEKIKFSKIDFIFCTDEYILDINKRYLNHHYFTDIITFDLTEQQNLIVGEVYISVDTVQNNAIQYGTSFNNELHRVIFHGILHLCGYKDKKKEDQKTMRHKENFYLSKYFES